MLRLFPLLIVVVILYNLVAFGSTLAGDPDIPKLLAHGFTLKMVSGDDWRITVGDGIILFAFMLLFAEIVKSSRAASRAFVEHALSFLTFAAAAAEFVLLKGFATSVFFFIALMTFFDVTAGYTIAILAAAHEEDEHHHDPHHDQHPS